MQQNNPIRVNAHCLVLRKFVGAPIAICATTRKSFSKTGEQKTTQTNIGYRAVALTRDSSRPTTKHTALTVVVDDVDVDDDDGDGDDDCWRCDAAPCSRSIATRSVSTFMRRLSRPWFEIECYVKY
jgi:hypothetical protein